MDVLEDLKQERLDRGMGESTRRKPVSCLLQCEREAGSQPHGGTGDRGEEIVLKNEYTGIKSCRTCDQTRLVARRGMKDRKKSR